MQAMITVLALLTTLVLCGLIVLTCYGGDGLLVHLSTSYPNNIYLRAMVDSATHASVGGLSWAVVESERLFVDPHSWMNCFLCLLLAAMVDVDHFLAAGSLDIQKAVSLPKRPLFHNSSLILAFALLCWTLRRYMPSLALFSLMFLCACFSHHLRDANHRGLWFYPFGHTPVFSFSLYVFFILSLAISVKIIHVYILKRSQSAFAVDVSIV